MLETSILLCHPKVKGQSKVMTSWAKFPKRSRPQGQMSVQVHAPKKNKHKKSAADFD